MAIPITLQATAQTDANGNATIAKVIRGAYWSAVYATAQCAGAAGISWVLGKVGQALAFQAGTNVVLGPVILAPNEQASLQVAGATPNSTLTVAFWGWQSAEGDGSDLAPLVTAIETMGSLGGTVTSVDNPESLNPRSPLTVPQTGINTFNVPVGASVQALLIAAPNGGPQAANWVNLQVTGHDTGSIYFYADTAQVAPFRLPTIFGVNPSIDRSYDFRFQYNSPGGAGNDIWQVGQATATKWVFNRLIAPTVASGDTIIGADLGTATNATGSARPGSGSLHVSHQTATPAPWQAPNQDPVTINSGSMATGALVTIVTGLPVGQFVYLHALLLMTPTAGATWCAIQDGGGTELARFDESNQKGQYADFKGARRGVAVPAAPNNVLRLFNGGVASTYWNGLITYSVSAT